MNCTSCKIQYVGKAGTSFKIRLNNHRSDVSYPNAMPACCHFSQDGLNFDIYAKFLLIETITDRGKPVQRMKECLRKWENFWIKTLETRQQHGFNHELNPLQP